MDAWTGDADSRDRAMMVVRMRLRMVSFRQVIGQLGFIGLLS